MTNNNGTARRRWDERDAIDESVPLRTTTHDIKKYALNHMTSVNVWLHHRDALAEAALGQLKRRVEKDGYWPLGPTETRIVASIFRMPPQPIKQRWWEKLLRRQRYTDARYWEEPGEASPDQPWLTGYQLGLTQHVIDLPPEYHPAWPPRHNSVQMMRFP